MQHTLQQDLPFVEFTLKHPDRTEPLGIEPHQTASWFSLTDSHYCLNLGTKKLYQYSKESNEIEHTNNSRFVDYYLVRFIEDFTEIFPRIATDVSENYYSALNSYSNLFEYCNEQKIRYGNDLTWVSCRTLTNNHLEFGPLIGFFKCKDEVKIIWKADQMINNASVWSAGRGIFSMGYNEFVSEVEYFGKRFFEAMELQIDLALQKKWLPIHLNEITLMNEQLVRKADFYRSLILLKDKL
ncbi:DUF5984 family protein [Dyadobacter alkalitolerans]|uniref:DUF5984 family protein n=1 Tax=Dyadobacter alkalitolerans TaxID=492736 RepID=UPI0003FDACE5|nr:DUF5984 family protein [Dyadobacter alkalitolerans]